MQKPTIEIKPTTPTESPTVRRGLFTMLYAAFLTGWLARPYELQPSEAVIERGRREAAKHATKILTSQPTKSVALVGPVDGDPCDACEVPTTPAKES